jgi:hypothetical protein
MPTERLGMIAQALKLCGINNRDCPQRHFREALTRYRKAITDPTSISTSAGMGLKEIENLSKDSLLSFASDHGIQLSRRVKVDEIRHLIMKHISEGKCFLSQAHNLSDGCLRVIDTLGSSQGPVEVSESSSIAAQISILEYLRTKLSLRPMRRLLGLHEVPFPKEAGLPKLQRLLRNYISYLKKGKRSEARSEDRCSKDAAEYTNFLKKKETIHREWPKLVPKSLKDKIVTQFHELTSKEALSSFTCAVCSEKCLNRDKCCVSPEGIDLNLLHRPDRRLDEGIVVDSSWLDPDCTAPPIPYSDGPLADVLVDSDGIHTD